MNSYPPPPPPQQPPPPGYGYPQQPGYGAPPGAYRPNWAPSPAPARTSPLRIVVIFVGVLLAVIVVAGIAISLSAPPPPVAPCAPSVPCVPKPTFPPIAASLPPGATPRPIKTPAPGSTPVPGATLAPVGTPTSDSPPVLSGTLYKDDSLGYSFEYDPKYFSMGKTGPGTAVLEGDGIDAVVWIDAKSADTAPAKLLETELADVDKFMIAREADSDTYDAVLGPSIGYVPGQGAVWAGTLVSKDGTPIEPGGVTALAATDGRITVAVVVIVGSPDHLISSDDTRQHGIRSLVDDVLKTFNWNAQ